MLVRWVIALSSILLGVCLPFGVAQAEDALTSDFTGDQELVRWSESAQNLDSDDLRQLPAGNSARLVNQLLKHEISLDSPIVVEISEGSHAFYDQDTRVVFVPIANLYRVYDALKAKFPEQEDVRRDIFNVTFQFYILSELLRAISMDLELRISGWEAERIDALVSIFLLESDTVSQSYILDAAEEFLLIDRVVASIDSQRFKTEFEVDEYRLSQVLCLMKAYDASKLDVRWDEPQGCSGYYQSTMGFWSKVLDEHLMENARLKRWSSGPKSFK